MKTQFTLIIIGIFISAMALATVEPKINLEVSLSRNNEIVCKINRTVVDGDSVLLCDGKSKGSRLFLNAIAHVKFDGSILIDAKITEITPDGVTINLSSPKVQTVSGTRAEISQTNELGKELLSLAVTPRLEN